MVRVNGAFGVAIQTFHKRIFEMFFIVAIVNFPEFFINRWLNTALSDLNPVISSLIILLVVGLFELLGMFMACETMVTQNQSFIKRIFNAVAKVPKAIPLMMVIIIFTVVGLSFMIFPGMVWFIITAFAYQQYYYHGYRDFDAIKQSFGFLKRIGPEAITVVSMAGLGVYMVNTLMITLLGTDSFALNLVSVFISGLATLLSYLVMTAFFIIGKNQLDRQKEEEQQ